LKAFFEKTPKIKAKALTGKLKKWHFSKKKQKICFDHSRSQHQPKTKTIWDSLFVS